MDGVAPVAAPTKRERWSSFVADRRERLLSFGSATGVLPSPESVADDWHSFVERLSDPRDVLQCLILAGPAAQTLAVDLPALYRTLRRTTVAKPVTTRGGLVGAPLWSRTMRERAAYGGDASIYVVASTARSSDVPENRGLLACLAYLDSTITKLARAAGGEDRLPSALQRIGYSARSGLKLPSLRDLPIEPLLTVRSRQAMARSRFPAFDHLAELSLAVRSAEDVSPIDLATSLAAAGWLAPLSEDDLFELFVLVKVVEAISGRWGEAHSLSPISRGNYIAEWHAVGTTRIRLFFNATPEKLRNCSRYLRVSRAYGAFFNASVRRPDIIVAIERGGSTSFTLIEIKNPGEESFDYRRDSLYKCFGYLFDFADELDKEQGDDICFLIFPEAVGPTVESHERVVAVSGEFGAEFSGRLVGRLESAAALLEL